LFVRPFAQLYLDCGCCIADGWLRLHDTIMANLSDPTEANRTALQVMPQVLPQPGIEHRETVLAYIAMAALLLIVGLAFLCPVEKVVLADRVTLLVLAATFFLLLYPPLLGLLEAQPAGVTFLLTAAMFVAYSLARRVVPEAGPRLQFASIPEDEFVFPYSAYVVVLGALFVSPYWWKVRNKWPHPLLAGLLLIAVMAGFSFWILGQHYPVGTTERVDPSSLPTLIFMIVEYGCLALLCRAVGFNWQVRRVMLRVLPPLLLALWARFHFLQPTEEAE
jgi:hypothetical protein